MRGTSLLIISLAAAAVAQEPAVITPPAPTQAWKRVFHTTGLSDSYFAREVVTDASGYAYIHYTDRGAGGTTEHLVKIGPTSNIVWDKTTSYASTDYPTSEGLAITPPGATQYVYTLVAFGNSPG